MSDPSGHREPLEAFFILVALGLLACDGVEILAREQRDAHSIAVDNSHVYWLVSNAVRKVPVNGGDVVTLANLGGRELALDETHVYWTQACALRGCGKVLKVPKAGGDVVVLTTGDGYSEFAPDSIVVHATGIYWMNELESVMHISKDGGAITRIVHDSDLDTTFGRSIAIDDDNIYWLTAVPPLVQKVPLRGGSVTTLADDLDRDSSFDAIAVGRDHVFWTDKHRLRRVPPNGGEAQVVAASEFKLGALALDSNNAYWHRGGRTCDTTAPCQDAPAAVMAAPLDPLSGAPARVLAEESGGNSILDLAVDASHVYWIDRSVPSSDVKRVAKEAN